MIKLAFIGPNRKIISFTVEERKVIYFDEIWNNGIQIYPYPKALVKKLFMSRRPQLMAYAELISASNRGKELEEYEKCKNDEEIGEIIRRDCLSKALIEIK